MLPAAAGSGCISRIQLEQALSLLRALAVCPLAQCLVFHDRRP